MTEEAEFELWQDDMPVATVEAPIAEAVREILHYALVYGQDGPVEIKRVMRETLTKEQCLALAFNSWEPTR